MSYVKCTFCEWHFPLGAVRCPHCARPSLFPNVQAAEDKEERNALKTRHTRALEECKCRRTAVEFEAAVGQSKAVIARPLAEVFRLASSEREIYATYYQLSRSGIKMTSGDKWDVLRRLADSALFPGYEEHIRFAALSLDNIGVRRYGECSIVLKDDMISHRASVFEENSVIFMDRHHIQIARGNRLPTGYRAIWDERATLVVAKLADKLTGRMQKSDFPRLLLNQGSKPEDDSFIEVHIWGPLTIRAIAAVVMHLKTKAKTLESVAMALREVLDECGVTWEDRH